LLFAQATPREVAFGHERDNVDDEVVTVEDRVHNNRNYGCEEMLAVHLDEDNREATGLENSTNKLACTNDGLLLTIRPGRCFDDTAPRLPLYPWGNGRDR
jgi:hypothetical protein